CTYGTNRRSNLERHERAKHSRFSGVPEQCCGQSFWDHFNLDRHRQLEHRAEYSYSCHRCPKSFKRRGLLARHMCTHTGVKSFACQVCDYGSPSKFNVDRHQESKHGIVKKQLRGRAALVNVADPVAGKDSGLESDGASRSRFSS
ncbi:unnamed protein product, partial [Ixodes hexagonus]